ncbi:MAG: ATP-grasp domain-containing protein [Myxococcales bacterium]|nr:ATP-grasp domain-containing protein [Myxococcales bacterium]
MDEAVSGAAERVAAQIVGRAFRGGVGAAAAPPWRAEEQRDPVQPGSGYVGAREVLACVLGLDDAPGGGRLAELASLPGGAEGHRLVALRYFAENADIWLNHFVWRPRLESARAAAGRDLVAEVLALAEQVRALRGQAPTDTGWVEGLLSSEGPLAASLDASSAREAVLALAVDPRARASLRDLLRERAPQLFAEAPALLDRLYLASHELHRYPATTVSARTLRYVLVADKGEMGVRAVREALALGLVPVVLHSTTDDADALQVRLARSGEGFAIGLAGGFRESYAGFVQIAERVRDAFRARFGEGWQDELGRAALYPGYGPLAENAAAIRHFRRAGITFVGPMEDVVEQAGDKRRFRAIVESIDPTAVTPGIVLDECDPARVRARVLDAHERGAFSFPGRLKAANGGGGRGQAIVPSADGLDAAIAKVLGEIESSGWDPGVMFEQNIPRTVHLEVQVLRDRYGNTRHFGMRDCTEQRASQKIQEEAPPAILRASPELRDRVERAAVAIADRVGYVGAGTIELMFADGAVYFLEMNTRIQVEHPVTEETHGIRRGPRPGRPEGSIERLDLVALQLRIANGEPIDFAQEDVVQTHVGRELRINAETWMAGHKDPRDGGRGLFVPNAGAFDRLEVPSAEAVLATLGADAAEIEDLRVRFDCGFEAGDVLVNKDPTFGKLIVAVRPTPGAQPRAYELLRRACLAVLSEVRVEGQQVRPDGRVVANAPFQTNVPAHRWVLEHEVLRAHCAVDATRSSERHVNWVVDALRTSGAALD